MSNDEWVVQIDTRDNLVGKVKREVAHNLNDLRVHREVMVLLYTDTKRDTFLLQHRSVNKLQLPGYWTLSVTGHVDFGDISRQDREGYLAAAKREAYEEIGIQAKNLKLVGKIEQKLSMNWAVMGVVVGEYENELKLDPEEVSEVGVFNKNSVLAISDKLTPGAKACLEYLGILNKEEDYAEIYSTSSL